MSSSVTTTVLCVVIHGCVLVYGGPHSSPTPPPGPLAIDTSQPGQMFHGVGGLSGGGATTRLLIDYPEEQKNQASV